MNFLIHSHCKVIAVNRRIVNMFPWELQLLMLVATTSFIPRVAGAGHCSCGTKSPTCICCVQCAKDECNRKVVTLSAWRRMSRSVTFQESFKTAVCTEPPSYCYKAVMQREVMSEWVERGCLNHSFVPDPIGLIEPTSPASLLQRAEFMVMSDSPLADMGRMTLMRRWFVCR